MTHEQKRQAVLDALAEARSGLYRGSLIARTKLTGDEVNNVLRALKRAGLVEGIGANPVLWRRT